MLKYQTYPECGQGRYRVMLNTQPKEHNTIRFQKCPTNYVIRVNRCLFANTCAKMHLDD